jgi:hypothetical protein
MAKNSKKDLVVSPSIKMSNMKGCISTRMNDNGNAVVIALQMLAGSPQENEFTPKGEKKPIKWTTLGRLDLDGTFEVGGVLCRFAVVKSKWGAPSLEVRPVTAKEEAEESTSLSF